LRRWRLWCLGSRLWTTRLWTGRLWSTRLWNQYGSAGAYGGQYSGVTTLGTGAPFGAAYGQSFAGGQFGGNQFVGGQNVQTVQGEPIYVAQPYPAYYGVAGAQSYSTLRGGFGAAALPFGLELGVGTNFDVGGDIFGAKEAGPAAGADGSPSSGRYVSAQPAIRWARLWPWNSD